MKECDTGYQISEDGKRCILIYSSADIPWVFFGILLLLILMRLFFCFCLGRMAASNRSANDSVHVSATQINFYTNKLDNEMYENSTKTNSLRKRNIASNIETGYYENVEKSNNNMNKVMERRTKDDYLDMNNEHISMNPTDSTKERKQNVYTHPDIEKNKNYEYVKPNVSTMYHRYEKIKPNEIQKNVEEPYSDTNKTETTSKNITKDVITGKKLIVTITQKKQMRISAGKIIIQKQRKNRMS